MAGRIFHLNEKGEATPMEEQPYDAEKALQELLAKHPDFLAGDQINSEEPRRWILVTREMAVPGEEEGAGRWSLDHLFLDQEAIPTLVEVKRSSDTRLRREVIGQMLDYAANAVVYWPMDEIRGKFEARCEAAGIVPEDELANLLRGEHETDEFWQQVKTNLQAGRIRLVFVADEIPAEVRRVVEFLNGQMDPAEVLAIEIKQYVGEGMKTLVPRVVGRTDKKAMAVRRERQWDEPSFFQTLRERRGEAEAVVAQQILDWAEKQSLRIWWGKGAKDGSFFPMLDWKDNNHSTVSVWTYGRLEIQFQWMKVRPPFDDEQKRQELRQRLNQIPGIDISTQAISLRPSVPLSTLTGKASMDQFLGTLDWLVQEIKAK